MMNLIRSRNVSKEASMSIQDVVISQKERILRERAGKLMVQLRDFCIPYFRQAFDERVRAMHQQIWNREWTLDHLKGMAQIELFQEVPSDAPEEALGEEAILRRAQEIKARPQSALTDEVIERWFSVHVAQLMNQWVEFCIGSARRQYPDSPRVYFDEHLLPVELPSEASRLELWQAVVEIALQQLITSEELKPVFARIKSEHPPVPAFIVELFEIYGVSISPTPVAGS